MSSGEENPPAQQNMGKFYRRSKEVVRRRRPPPIQGVYVHTDESTPSPSPQPAREFQRVHTSQATPQAQGEAGPSQRGQTPPTADSTRQRVTIIPEGNT